MKWFFEGKLLKLDSKTKVNINITFTTNKNYAVKVYRFLGFTKIY